MNWKDHLFGVLGAIAVVGFIGLAGALDDETSALNHFLHNLTLSNGDSQ